MTDNARPRHAAEGRASRIAKRAAIGVIGAPVAMLAAAGPASAAAIDLDGVLNDGQLDLQLSADGSEEASLAGIGLPALPEGLPLDGLPLDGAVFEGVPLDLLDLAGALPGLATVTDLASLSAAEGVLSALPAGLPTSVEDVELPAAEDLVDSIPVELPALPVVGDVEVPDGLPAVPDVVGTVTGLAGGLPTAAQLDLDDVSEALPTGALDVFSADDLVGGIL